MSKAHFAPVMAGLSLAVFLTVAAACKATSPDVPTNKPGERDITPTQEDTIPAPQDTTVTPSDTIPAPQDTLPAPQDTIVPPADTVPVTPEEPLIITQTATILPLNQYGRVTGKFLYDIKQGNCTPIPQATAQMLFGQFKMNGLRIPIYGTASNGGHTAPGVIGDGVYDKILAGIATAKAAYKGDGPFYIFASKKLDDKEKKSSFPAWTKDAQGILPGPYSTMLLDYIRYMKEQGVEIDVLGIDNESNFHEGNVTADRFAATVDSLKPKLIKEGLKVPLFIGHERYNPERAANYWLKQLYDSKKQDRLDIYGTHYYPRHHVTDFNNALKKEWTLSNSDRFRPFWATEPHWDNDDEAKADMLLHSESAMGAMFDQTDLGLDAFCWWSFKYEGNMRASMMRELSLGIYNSRPIRVNDHDGSAIITPGTFVTRAFMRGNEIILFVQNVTAKGATGKSYPAYQFRMNALKIASAKGIQWRDDTPDEGAEVVFKRITSEDVVLEIPSRSVTKITFEISD